MSVYIFAERLKELRLSHNLTQKKLGFNIGISKAVISKYENGIGYPSLDTLIIIAKYFKVTTDYLLGVEKENIIDVSNLNDKQIAIVYNVISEFADFNKYKISAE